MQNKIEIDKIFLQRLNQRLAASESDRYRLQKELKALTKTTSRGRWIRANVAALCVLAVSPLLFDGIFHDAQSNVKKNGSLEVTGQIMRNGQQSASVKKAQLQSDKKKSHYVSRKAASQRQWGPLLVMPEPEAKKRYYAYDSLVKEQQENLLTLGFDIGEADGFKGLRTRQAIAEFRALYLPDSAKQLKDDELAVIIASYANLARSDAARFGIDHGIVAAIRLSSVRTGVNFSYLMKLAATESNFKPAIEATTSSATGIYQFTHDTWLNTLKTHGAKYGLVVDYTANIEHYETIYGYQRPIVRDELMYQHLLALRKNPRLSAIMAAEMVRDNLKILDSSINREATETDLYLTHFLGTNAAITFLQSLERTPDTHAVELFPSAAKSNYAIFYPKTCAPRTVDEVYSHFGEKFSTRRYEDLAAN